MTQRWCRLIPQNMILVSRSYDFSQLRAYWLTHLMQKTTLLALDIGNYSFCILRVYAWVCSPYKVMCRIFGDAHVSEVGFVFKMTTATVLLHQDWFFLTFKGRGDDNQG